MVNYEKWMSECLSSPLGDLQLKSFVLPASHDAGMSFCRYATSLANSDMTVTQVYPIREQLKLGVRLFDVRPLIRHQQYLCGHVENVKNKTGFLEIDPVYGKWLREKVNNIVDWQGGFGESIDDIVRAVNEFTSQNPELIIINIHDWCGWNADNGFKPFTDDEWDGLFNKLKELRNLFTPTADKDLRDYTLKDYIGKGSGSVVCVVSQGDAQSRLGHLRGKGFFDSSKFHGKDWAVSLPKELNPAVYVLLGLRNIVEIPKSPDPGSPWDVFVDIVNRVNPYRAVVDWAIASVQKAFEPSAAFSPNSPIIEQARNFNKTAIPGAINQVGVNSDGTPKYPIIWADAIENTELAKVCLQATLNLAKSKINVTQVLAKL